MTAQCCGSLNLGHWPATDDGCEEVDANVADSSKRIPRESDDASISPFSMPTDCFTNAGARLLDSSVGLLDRLVLLSSRLSELEMLAERLLAAASRGVSGGDSLCSRSAIYPLPHFYRCRPLGFIRSAFPTKNGAPRQGVLCPELLAELRLSREIFNNPAHALDGLANFTHIWLIFWFHLNDDFCRDSNKTKLWNVKTCGQKIFPDGSNLSESSLCMGNTNKLSSVQTIRCTKKLDSNQRCSLSSFSTTRDVGIFNASCRGGSRAYSSKSCDRSAEGRITDINSSTDSFFNPGGGAHGKEELTANINYSRQHCCFLEKDKPVKLCQNEVRTQQKVNTENLSHKTVYGDVWPVDSEARDDITLDQLSLDKDVPVSSRPRSLFRRSKAKVRPPRLDSSAAAVGVFSTRSPHRPNPIGLTLARLVEVRADATIVVTGVDLVDGTPILDVKPFIEHYDCPLQHQVELTGRSSPAEMCLGCASACVGESVVTIQRPASALSSEFTKFSNNVNSILGGNREDLDCSCFEIDRTAKECRSVMHLQTSRRHTRAHSYPVGSSLKCTLEDTLQERHASCNFARPPETCERAAPSSIANLAPTTSSLGGLLHRFSYCSSARAPAFQASSADRKEVVRSEDWVSRLERRLSTQPALSRVVFTETARRSLKNFHSIDHHFCLSRVLDDDANTDFTTLSDHQFPRKCSYCLKFVDEKRLMLAVEKLLLSDLRSNYRKTKCSDRIHFVCIDSVKISAWYDSQSTIHVLDARPTSESGLCVEGANHKKTHATFGYTSCS